MKNNYAWKMLICSCLLVGAGQGILVSCTGIFIQPVCDANGFSVGLFSTYLSIGAVAMMVGFPLADKVMKKFPLKPLLVVCVLVNCGVFMLYSTFNQLWMFYIAVLFTGLACVIPAYMMGPLLVANWFEEKRGLAMGIAMACTGIFGAIFSIVGGMIIANMGYKMGYIILGIIALVFMLPSVLMLVIHPAQKGMLPYGAKEGTQTGEDKVQTMGIDQLDGVSKSVALKSTPFIFIFFTIFIMVCLGSFSPQVSVLAMNNGFDIATASAFASVFMIGSLAGSFILGVFNDKIGVRNTTVLVSVIGILSVAAIVFGQGNQVIFVVALVLMGIAASAGGIQPPMIVGSLFGQKDYTGIYGVIQLALSLGGVVATPIYGFVLDATGSFNGALIGVAVALMVSILFTLLSFKGRDKLWAKEEA